MKLDDIVSRNPEIMNGALVFAGTRVPVEILIQHLTAGDSLDTFLSDFPTVAREQAVAYLEHTLETASDARASSRTPNRNIEGPWLADPPRATHPASSP